MKGTNKSLEVKNILFGEIEYKKTFEEIVKSNRDDDDSGRISISRCPELIKSTVWFLKSKDENLRTEAKTTRCLTKAGLQILQSIPGVEMIEMERSRETSLCCGGGGGRMWFEGHQSGAHLSHERVREALTTGAQILATACPFCLNMLDDAIKTMGVDDQIEIKDIMELVFEAL